MIPGRRIYALVFLLNVGLSAYGGAEAFYERDWFSFGASGVLAGFALYCLNKVWPFLKPKEEPKDNDKTKEVRDTWKGK